MVKDHSDKGSHCRHFMGYVFLLVLINDLYAQFHRRLLYDIQSTGWDAN